MSEPTHYDREELTRPGHTPSLITGPGVTRGSCSCGWWRQLNEPSMSRTVRDIRAHIADVDAGIR